MVIWDRLVQFIHDTLFSLSDVLSFMGESSLGWAIIAITLLMRVLLLPLAIKQTRSMRGMQELQPKIKSIQAKYKVNRDMAKKDPAGYRERKAKANEEVMALYKEAGVNPAAGCLPLIAQMPLFFALFRVLRDTPELKNATFYFFTDFIKNAGETFQNAAGVAETFPAGLGANVSNSGWPGLLLMVLMGATMFITQKQMMARNSGPAEGTAAQQQKIMLYVMPVMLAVFSWNLPLGVLLYWVTTNIWQAVQQQIILREVGPANPPAASAKATPVAEDDAPKAPKKTPKKSVRDLTAGDKAKDASAGGSARKLHPKQIEKQQKAADSAPTAPESGFGRKRNKKSHLPGGEKS